jgi:hypothetical protein
VQKVISAQNLFTRKRFAVYTLHRLAFFGILQFIARKLENTVNIISVFQEIHMASLDFTYFRSQKNLHNVSFYFLTIRLSEKNIEANIFDIKLSQIFLARFISSISTTSIFSFILL